MSDPTDLPPEPFDATLIEMFASARPDAGLEDRVIRSLRAADTTVPRKPFTWRRHPLAWGVAASVGLGAVGAAVSSQLGGGGLPLPWETREGLALQQHAKATRELLPPDSAIVDGLSDRGHSLAGSRFGFDYDSNSNSTLWMYSPPSAGREDEQKKAWGTMATAERSKKASEAAPGGGQIEAFDLAGAPGMGGGRPASGGAPAPGTTNGTVPGNQLLRYYATPEFEGRNKVKKTDGEFNPNSHRWDDTVAVIADLDKQKGPVEAKLKAVVVDEKALGKLRQESTVLFSQGGATPVTTTAGVNFNTTQPAEPVKVDPPAAGRKVILRSGDIEFEVESFDSAVAAVTKLVTAIDGAFIATVNSEKLPNGKVKGTVAVRVPPDKLDGLVLDLRRDLGKGGELKGQRIGSQDVTKQYTDLESRLKAARTMETRLLAIIKDGKGEIKQLLDAEKELGVWRTKIEEMEGEKRYFDTLAALSTLTITLAEKEIKAAAGVTETEVVQTGIEVEDVEQAFRDALAAVTAANGRVTKSDLKQVSAGQFNATLVFEVAPNAAGPVRDRLRQLGRVARLEIARVAAADPGGTVTKDAKVKRGDTQFNVQLYNVANMAPRETATLTVATLDVPAGFRAVRESVEKAKGRILTAVLTERQNDKENVKGNLDFEVKRADEGAVLAALGAAGEVVSRQTNRAAEADGVTDTKVRIHAEFVNARLLAPRETTTLAVETDSVDAAGAVLTTAAKDAGGRVVDSGTATDRGTGKITARYVVDVPLASAAGIAEKAKANGSVKVNEVSRNAAATEGRFATARLSVTFTTLDRIVAPDDGFVPQVKKGLQYSVAALFASLTWLVFGLLVVLPWAAVLYVGFRVVRRVVKK
jgi:hypothetical protein